MNNPDYTVAPERMFICKWCGADIVAIGQGYAHNDRIPRLTHPAQPILRLGDAWDDAASKLPALSEYGPANNAVNTGETEFYCKDDPESNGRTPKVGDQRYTLTFTLADGRTIKVHQGLEGMNTFTAMLSQMMVDDAEGRKESTPMHEPIPLAEVVEDGPAGRIATEECTDCTKLIQERDELEERLDDLAQFVSDHFEVPIGEHSSANDPIAVAFDILGGAYKTKYDNPYTQETEQPCK